MMTTTCRVCMRDLPCHAHAPYLRRLDGGEERCEDCPSPATMHSATARGPLCDKCWLRRFGPRSAKKAAKKRSRP